MGKLRLRAIASVSALAVLAGMALAVDIPAPAFAAAEDGQSQQVDVADGGASTSSGDAEEGADQLELENTQGDEAPDSGSDTDEPGTDETDATWAELEPETGLEQQPLDAMGADASLQQLDAAITPFSVPNFTANQNVFYTLDRSVTSIGSVFNRRYDPTVSIRQLSFNPNNGTPIAQSNTIMGGAQQLTALRGTNQNNLRVANSLGVTPDGVFYFTTQQGTDARVGAVDIWKYEMMSMPGEPHPGNGICVNGTNPVGSTANGYACAPVRVVADLSLNSAGGGTIVGGAVNPHDGAFYFMYFSGTPQFTSVPQGPLNPYGPGNVRAHLYRYDANRSTIGQPVAGEVTHFDIRQHEDFGTTFNGDIAFDANGSLLLSVSNNGGTTSQGQMMLATAEFEKFGHLPSIQYTNAGAPSVPTIFPTSTVGAYGQTKKLNPSNSSGVNGLAYTSTGHLVVQQGDSQALANPADFVLHGIARTNSTRTGDFVDLASATSPPILTVQKFVEQERFATGDQFTLSGYHEISATNTINFDSITTEGDAAGRQQQQIGPLPLFAGGAITVGEAITPVENAASYSSTYECFIENSDGTKGQVFKQGEGRTVTFDYLTEVPGANSGPQQMKCVFTNGPLRPNLETSKSANPESLTNVAQGDTVQYKLTFDNSDGLASADVDHTDYLADVLDDADFVVGSIRYGDGTETAYPAAATAPFSDGVTATAPDTSHNMGITGTVPAESTRTVWFEVMVKQNSADRAGSNTETEYVLNNFLRPTGETPPADCEPEDPNCTTHPIEAWTVSKQSQPPNGAWLHSGGNVYYMVNVTKVGAQDSVIEGIEVVDDMSEVMAVARMDPNAPNYGPQYQFDVKTYDANDTVVRSFATATNTWDGGVAYSQEQLYPVHSGSDDPAESTWKWSTTLPAFTLAANEVRAQIVYVVKVGGAADPEDPTQFQVDASDNPLYLPPLREPFVNTVGAISQTMPPNECVLDTTPVDPQCQVSHQVSDNYFHIQKNSTELDAEGKTIWNLQGVEFGIADAELKNGWPTGSQSANLCWSNYAAEYDELTGVWVPPLDTVGTYRAGAVSDWHSAASETYQSLVNYNSYLIANGQQSVPMCALSYALEDDSFGQAAGTWHVSDLTAGSYQLIETKAPEGHQLLAEPIAFVVFGDDYQLQLPDPNNAGLYLDRCGPGNPENLPTNGTSACVMQTGWLMQVYDAKLRPLPLTGGQLLGFLTTGGIVVLVGAVAGVMWWRRREANRISAEELTQTTP